MVLSYHVNCKKHHNFGDVNIGEYGCLIISETQYLPVASPVDIN